MRTARNTMSATLIAALLIAIPAAPPASAVAGFGDVAGSKFYTEAVQWLVDEAITTGTAPGCFSPGREVTRGELATFLWRFDGEPDSNGEPFVDVSESDFFQAAVAWMSNTGITTGTSLTTFDPHRTVTRGETAAFLWRYSGQPTGEDHEFADVAPDSFYNEAVAWLSSAKITSGTSPTTFDPERPVTRAEAATFLHRLAGSPVAAIDPTGTCPTTPGENPGWSETPSGDGETFYVDATAGSDSRAGTSPSTAWQSLGHAAAQLSAGDSLLLSRGKQWGERLEIEASGNADDPIVVASYGAGSDPVITGSSTCVRLTGDYIVVRGLTIRDCSWAGVGVSGTGNRVEGNLITKNVAGVYVKDTAVDTGIFGNEIKDNDVMSVNDPGGSGDSGAFGVLIHGDRTEVAYNTISGSDAFSYDYGRDGAAIEIYGGSDSHIHHNRAFDNDAFAELGEPGSSGNRFDHNVVTSSLETSVFLVTRGGDGSRGPVVGTTVEHNSVLLTGTESQGFICHDGCETDILILRNNIIEAQKKVGYADGPFAGGNNVFYGGQTQFDLSIGDVFADPQWVDRSDWDLHTSSGSPAIAINAGAYQ